MRKKIRFHNYFYLHPTVGRSFQGMPMFCGCLSRITIYLERAFILHYSYLTRRVRVLLESRIAMISDLLPLLAQLKQILVFAVICCFERQGLILGNWTLVPTALHWCARKGSFLEWEAYKWYASELSLIPTTYNAKSEFWWNCVIISFAIQLRVMRLLLIVFP